MEEQEINLGEILDALYFDRVLIAKIVVVFTIIGLFYIIFAEPIFQSDMMIQIENNQGLGATPTALSNISQLFGGKSEADAEMQILGSRMVLSKAIDDMQLDIDSHPRYFPLIGSYIASHNSKLSKPGFLGMGGYAWGSEKIGISQFKVPRDWENEKLYVVAEAGEHYRVEGPGVPGGVEGKLGETLQVKVSPPSKGIFGWMQDRGAVSEVIELRIDNIDANPETKFVLMHYSPQRTLEKLRNRLTITEKVRQSDILNVTLEGADPQTVVDELNDIGMQYVFQNIENNSAEAEKTLHFLDKFLPNLKVKLNAGELKTASMKAARGMINESEQAKAILQQMVEAKRKMVELRAKRDELLTRYTLIHPEVRAINAQILGLQNEVANIKTKIEKMPDMEREVLEQERDVQVDMDTYNNLLATAQQMRLLKEGSIGNVRIIDKANLAERPIKPNKLQISILSMLLGILVGVATVLIRKHLFGGVENAHELEHIGFSVLASVPLSKVQQSLSPKIEAGEHGLFMLEQVHAHDAAIESLRSLRTALQFSMQGASNNLVMISGATPEVGKSFISANMASVIAASGKRVLLIDLDLRKGHLHHYFGLQRVNGITELITGERTFNDVVHRDLVPALDFISTGILPSAPHLLISHGNLKRFLEMVMAEYDIVLIDTPPVLAVADSSTLSSQIGSTILVAREGMTTLGDLQETVKRFRQAGAKITGVVLNLVRHRPGKYGYKYGKYRYSYETYMKYAKDK